MKSEKLNKRTLDPIARQDILNSLASLYENLRKNPTDQKTRENVQMHSDTEEDPHKTVVEGGRNKAQT